MDEDIVNDEQVPVNLEEVAQEVETTEEIESN